VTLIVEPDAAVAATLRFALGEGARTVENANAAARDLTDHPDELLVVLGPGVDLRQGLDQASTWRVDLPEVGVVLLRRRIDVQVLGQALRAGVREVVSPDDLGAVVEATRRSLDISRRRRRAGGAGSAERRPEGRVVTVFSAKGGCGKTTVSTNLAGVLAADGATRVCVVDLDLEFGDVAISLQMPPERTIVDAVPLLGTMDEQGLRAVVTTHSPGLDTVLAPSGPGEVSQIQAKLIPELIGVLKRMYDVVIIDTPPAFTEQVLAAFDVSDVYILLATLDVPALKNLKLSIETLDVLGYPRENLLVVLNRADARVGLDLDDVERTLGTGIAVQIPSSGDVPASVNRGAILARESAEHPVSRALWTLAHLVSDRANPVPRQQPRRSSGLRTLLRRGAR
jgi:pilus assembly protein CpaE